MTEFKKNYLYFSVKVLHKHVLAFTPGFFTTSKKKPYINRMPEVLHTWKGFHLISPQLPKTTVPR